MPIKWIISDVDGCLAPEESAAWNLQLFNEMAQICRAASRGDAPQAPMTLCTGRPQPYVEVLMKLLDVRAPAICENGAVIYTLHDNIARYGPGVTEEKILGLRAVRAFIESTILPAFPDAVVQFGKEAQISVFSQKPSIFPETHALIDQFVQQRGGPELLISDTHFYQNISLAGVDKGAALRVLMEELGVDSSEVAGIGDTEGDLPLREVVGFFACPANSRDSIKKVADYVSPYETLEGVLDILQRPEFMR
jgi:HAD superfamily hydrolase (TIGR01484 family)